MRQALMIGNSDGIGLAVTQRLLKDEWHIIGISRLQICMAKKPTSYTAPRIVIPLVKFRKLMMKLGGK